MKYIDENKIQNILELSKNHNQFSLDEILEKAKELKGLNIEEVAFLLNVEDENSLERVFKVASFIKNEIYGKRIVIFAPLYTSNICNNNCLYCSFQINNKILERKALSYDEIKAQTEILLKKGQKRILIVSGESDVLGKKPIDYYLECIKAVYDARYKASNIRRVNINVAPLEIDEFRELKKANIGTYQIFQETYHEKTYKKLHTFGPKIDPDKRISAIDNAFLAGIDDVGMGVLLGLYDYKFDILALFMHIEAIQSIYGIGPHTISVPRLEPSFGVNFEKDAEFYNFVSDKDFKKIVAILRIAVPYTGIILSTRETKDMRNFLLNLGISQMSAESSVEPGGYDKKHENNQFILSDSRPLEDVVESIIDYGYIPSFCTACYRKERTGKTFMNLAKPGNIKYKCHLNSLITLKEYVLEFGNEKIANKANNLIDNEMKLLNEKEKTILKNIFLELEKGKRDIFL